MDEPDNFLSASAQRSLLRVFEALVGAKVAKGTCQLIYTTHSPFLINRNFPERIRLVRKGDGSEGTQYVDRSAVRRFEPIRSALSIDAADTLFLGSINVILEGPSDQRLLAACIQKFGKPGALDEFIDLNSVTLVSSGGAPYAADLVRNAVKGDEKPPIVVALLDGDERGANAVAKISEEIDSRQAATLRQVEAGPGRVFEVLEDVVPSALMNEAISKFAVFVGDTLQTVFDGRGEGNAAKKVERFCRTHLPSTTTFTGIEIRSGVMNALVELLSDEKALLPDEAQLRSSVISICAKLNTMIAHAQRNAAQRSLKYTVGLQIDSFLKWHPEGASKGELKQLLENIQQAAFGKGRDHKSTRSNCEDLIESLDAQITNNSDQVDLADWKERLKAFAVQPWGGRQVKPRTTSKGIPKNPGPADSTSAVN